MLKPKTHNFRLKVMLSKLEAVSNKVASRCHASLRVDNEDLSFKLTPELKKNVAVFNAEVEAENFCIQFDEVTGLYEGKTATLQFQLETQGTKVKIGEVQLNLGGILNEKKYRIVNSFPLSKCYDKTAKAKISVDFVPLSAPAQQGLSFERREKREIREIRQGSQKDPIQGPLGSGLGVAGSGWKQTAYKSRLAEESNYILQEKIYEYQQKMDNYRLSQTQLQERLHEQISNKDEQIAELTGDVTRKANQISSLTLQIEQLRFRLKEAGDELAAAKQGSRSLMSMLESVQHEEQDLKREVQVLKASLDNITKAKDSKERHFAQELSKYTQRYLESEQERNKIVFLLQSKFKEQIDKKELNYSTLIAASDKKHTQASNALRHRIKELENEVGELNSLLEGQVQEGRKLNEQLNNRSKELADTQQQLKDSSAEKERLQTTLTHLSNELETLTFSYHQSERQTSQLKEEVATGRRAGEQLRMELQMANQTIEEQRKALSKYGKELQVHQERAYYLAEKYNDELEIKSQQEENIRGESMYYREELHRLASQLRLAQDHAEEEAASAEQLREALQRVEAELATRGQALVRAGQERMLIETQNRTLREELSEMQEAVLMLKQENLQLGDYLREKKAAQDTDKSLEWSYKIEELQQDISQMVEKFKVERESFLREDAKRREEITAQAALLRRARDESQELRRILVRKDSQLKEYQQSNEQMKVALRQRAEEVAEGREKMRIYAAQVEELESRLQGAEEREAAKLREAEERHQKEMKTARKAESLKAGFSKALTHVLDHLTRPYTAAPIFQELLLPDLDADLTNMVNLALKKHCEERTKIRETIKRLEGESFFKPEQREKESGKFSQFSQQQMQQERRLATESNETSLLRRTYLREEVESPWKMPTRTLKDSSEADSLREENARLKRELSELRVRIRQLEEQAGRAQKNADNERYSRQEARQEVEDLQDELQKVAFQLKRKEKLIQEYEAEMRDMQAELLTSKSLQAPPNSTPSKTPSRLQNRKEDNAQSSRNAVILRDLEARLEQRSKENEELAGEMTRLKGQNGSLNEVISNLRSEIKVLEGRLKEKTAKAVGLEEQLVSLKASLEEQHHQVTLQQQRRIADLQEQAAASEEEARRCQLAAATLEKELGEAERRVKQARDDARTGQGRIRREAEQTQTKLQEKIQELEHTILTLQSQIEQLSLRNKQANNKINSLSSIISKKSQEIDRQTALLAARSIQVTRLQQQSQQRLHEQQRRVAHFAERLQQTQRLLQQKEYELQQYRFTSEGKLMDLQKRLEQTVQLYNRPAP